MIKISKCNTKLIKHQSLNWWRCPNCGSTYFESHMTLTVCTMLLTKDNKTPVLTEAEFRNLSVSERNSYVRYVVQFWQEYQNSGMWNPLTIKYYSSLKGLHLTVKKQWEATVQNKNVKLASIIMLQ